MTVRKIAKINRKLHPSPSGVEVEAEVADEGCGFEKAHETELRERKILKIRRKTEDEEKIESAEESAADKVAAQEAETKEDICERRKKGDVTLLTAGLENGKVITIT